MKDTAQKYLGAGGLKVDFENYKIRSRLLFCLAALAQVL
jgi:hypothetical protein